MPPRLPPECREEGPNALQNELSLRNPLVLQGDLHWRGGVQRCDKEVFKFLPENSITARPPLAAAHRSIV